MHAIGIALRFLLAPMLLVTLASCWTGDPWFDAAEAVAVIPDGRYRLAETGATAGGDRLDIRRQRDNSLIVTGPDNPWRAIIVPLDPEDKNRFVIQLQEQNPRHPTHALFVLLDASKRRYRIAVLDCRGAAAQAVKDTGGRISSDPQSGASCIFADRATLLAQLRAASTEKAGLDLELVRDGD